MTSNAFYEDSNLLTPAAFAFVLDGQLRRAVRSQNYLTLVTLEASREWQGMTVPVDQGTVQDVAQIIGREIRETDLIGHTEDGVLALVLLDADVEHTAKVIDRVVARMEHHEFPAALRIAVGAACYPTDAVDAASLTRQAMSHPVASWRGKSSGGNAPCSSN
jgi:hypothetical protein